MANRPSVPPRENACFTQFEAMFTLRSTELSRSLPSWEWVAVRGMEACSVFFVFPTITQVTDLRWSRFPLMFCVLMTLTPWLFPRLVSRVVSIPMGKPLIIERSIFPKFAPFIVLFSRAALIRQLFLFLPFILVVYVAPHVLMVNGGLRFWWDVPIGFVAMFLLSWGADPLLLGPLAIAFCPSSMRLYYRNGYRSFPLDRRLCVYEIVSAVIPGLSSRVAIVYEGRCVLIDAVIEDMFPVAQDLQAKRSVIKTLQGFLGEGKGKEKGTLYFRREGKGDIVL